MRLERIRALLAQAIDGPRVPVVPFGVAQLAHLHEDTCDDSRAGTDNEDQQPVHTPGSSSEIGLAFVEERSDAFEAFRTAHLRNDGLALQHHLTFQRPERFCDQALRAAKGACSTGGEAL